MVKNPEIFKVRQTNFQENNKAFRDFQGGTFIAFRIFNESFTEALKSFSLNESIWTYMMKVERATQYNTIQNNLTKVYFYPENLLFVAVP